MPDVRSDLMRLRNLRLSRGEIRRRMDAYLEYACRGVSTRTATRISGGAYFKRRMISSRTDSFVCCGTVCSIAWKCRRLRPCQAAAA